MKALFTSVILLLSIFSANSQRDSLEERIIYLLEVSDARKGFDVAINQMMDMQKDLYQDILDDEFWIAFKKEITLFANEELYEMIVPIYKKHFTIEDVEELIKFNKSEIGQKLNKKMPLILKESMAAGGKWGEKLATKIIANIEDSDEYKMNISPDNCDEVKNGRYQIIANSTDTEINRNGDSQDEYLNGVKECNFKVEWISSCKYTLNISNCRDKSIEKDFKGHTLITNIYEVTDNGYKFITHFEGEEDMAIKGEAKRVKKSNSRM